MDAYTVLLAPVVTEKVHIQKESNNKITFKVHKNSRKDDIKKAVESALNVKVLKVNVLNQEGKKKRLGKHQGKRPNFKKAIVTLGKEEKVPLFES